MSTPLSSIQARWARAASLMERHGIDAVIHGEEKIETVEAGMVLAIGKCGIYRECFGVRAEDTVWVSERGPVSRTRCPKSLRV